MADSGEEMKREGVCCVAGIADGLSCQKTKRIRISYRFLKFPNNLFVQNGLQILSQNTGLTSKAQL